MKTQLTRLNDLIPDYYDDIIEPHELAAAEQPLLDDLEAAIFDAQSSQSVITADSAALSVYESMLGIVPKLDEDLETRCYNVLMDVLPPQPLTETYLDAVLKMLNINATVNVFGRQFEVNVVSNPTDQGSTQRLTTVLNRYMPSNLTYTHSIVVPASLHVGVVARFARNYSTRSALLDDRQATTTASATRGNFVTASVSLQSTSSLLSSRTISVTTTPKAGTKVGTQRRFVTEALTLPTAKK